MARVHDMLRHLRQMFRRDHQHVGAVFGERARRDRAGKDARQVEHLDSRQRPLAFGERDGIGVADLGDVDQRSAGQHFAVRMLQPFGIGADDRAAGARLGDRFFEIVRIPFRDRFLDEWLPNDLKRRRFSAVWNRGLYASVHTGTQ